MPRTLESADFKVRATDALEIQAGEEPVPAELLEEKEKIEREALAERAEKKRSPLVVAWVGNLLVPGFGPAFLHRGPATLALLAANLALMVALPSPFHFLQVFFGAGAQFVSFSSPLNEQVLRPYVGAGGAAALNQAAGALLYLQTVLVAASWLWLAWLTWAGPPPAKAKP